MSSLLLRFRAIWSRLFFTPKEKNSLLALKARYFAQEDQCTGTPYVVLVEGFLASRFVALYYTLLLLLIQHKTGRPVRVVLLTTKSVAKRFAASRLYGLFFPLVTVNAEEVLDAQEANRARCEALDLESKSSTPRELFELRYKGVRIGRDVYYAHIRNKLVGTVEKVDFEVQQVLHEAVRNYAVANKVIDRYQPALLLITDNCYEKFSPYFYSCLSRSIPVALTVAFAAGTGKVGGRMYTSLADAQEVVRRYTFSFDDNTWGWVKQGYGPREDEMVDQYLQQRFAGNDLTFNGDYHKNTSRLIGAEMSKALGIAEGDSRRRVLIAAHLLWDDPGYEGLFADYEIWVKETLQTIACNREVLWILKAHPSEKHMGAVKTVQHVVHDVFGQTLPENIRFLDGDTTLNTYSLIDHVDAVLTVRGTIGFEAGCKGKPVITAGDGPFSGLGFSTEFTTPNEYRTYLLNFHQVAIAASADQIRRARMALYGYFVLKMPVSKVLLRGEDLSSYGDLGVHELRSDPTLNRFAEKLASQSSGDLL